MFPVICQKKNCSLSIHSILFSYFFPNLIANNFKNILLTIRTLLEPQIDYFLVHLYNLWSFGGILCCLLTLQMSVGAQARVGQVTKDRCIIFFGLIIFSVVILNLTQPVFALCAAYSF